MFENEKYLNYDDCTVLLEESIDQVDTTLEIGDEINKCESLVINNNNKINLLYDIYHHFQKTMSVEDSILFILTIIICTVVTTSLIIFYLDEKREYNTYYFTPDYKITFFEYRDIIDTEEKLTTILMDSSIVKEFSPKKGDFVIKREAVLSLESYEYTLARNKIYPLVNKQVITYKNSKYEFILNTITVSKNPRLAEKIKTTKVQNALLKKDCVTINKNNIKIGSFVLLNMAGRYMVVLDKNISQEHLIDSSKDKLININELI